MRKALKENLIKFSSLFLLLVMYMAMCLSGLLTAPPAYADKSLNYDKTNVFDDLTGSTIGGNTFDLSDYPFNERGKPQIIAFIEYAYSFYSDNQNNYGLYVYVYNPQGLAIDTDTDRNKIEFAYAEKEIWDKYKLQFLNYSTQSGYEGLFYKFKVVLTPEEKADILLSVNQNSRVYEIVGIEVSVSDNVTDYTVAMRYTYSGFSLGYGSALATESSLSCYADGFEKYLNLDVHPTYYRPDGTNGKNDYTQDSLHSVYFAVPKETVNEYGAISAVHATWLNAVLAPALVTGNLKAHDAIKNYLGQNVGVNNSDLKYAYLGACEKQYSSSGAGSAHNLYSSDYAFNMVEGIINQKVVGDFYDEIKTPAERINSLYWLFYSGSKEDSADNYIVSSEEIFKQLSVYTQEYGGELVNSRYSRVLFESVADNFTTMNIAADFEYDLKNEVVGSSWWDKLWGVTYPNTFNGIKAIDEVSDDIFVWSGEEIDIPSTCDRLYIAEQDFTKFKQFYDENKKDNVIYLFRYRVSDYISQEATLFEGAGTSWKESDTNAYFMQMSVDLDFDIIDITFTKDNVSTIIPVVASPVDNIPDGTPPVNTNSDKNKDWWKIILAILALIVLLVILMPILPFIAKFVVWLILLPFKLIGAIFKGIGKLFHKKE